MTYVRRKIQTYTKVYFEAFGYDYEDDSVFVPSELTGKKAVDIHHIIGRGKCGENRIENLMALTREEHVKYGDKVSSMVVLLEIHRDFLGKHNIEYDNNWFEKWITHYKSK